MFQRHLIRKGVQEMTSKRDSLIAAVHSNPTWNENANSQAKQDLLDAIHEAWAQGVEIAYNGVSDAEQDPDAMENDPLFGPFFARAQGVIATSQPPVMEQAGMGQAILS